MHLSPRRIYAEYKKGLLNRGIKNPHKNIPTKINSQFANRKPSIQMIMKKLNLSDYNVKPNFVGIQPIKLVRIPLNKHVGSPAIPQVKVGQTVRRCDIIAATPQDKLGAIYHASIDGRVTEITENYIEIKS
jgi:hypothetical protein